MTMAPMTMMALGTVASVGSAIVGTMAQMQALEYQAAVAARNQQIAEENARRELERSQVEQQDWSEEARGQLGQLLAALSASGVAIDAGSAALQRRGARGLAQRDASRIREEGVSRADRMYQQAADFGADARGARARAGFLPFTGALGALDSFVSGATRINRARGLIT